MRFSTAVTLTLLASIVGPALSAPVLVTPPLAAPPDQLQKREPHNAKGSAPEQGTLEVGSGNEATTGVTQPTTQDAHEHHKHHKHPHHQHLERRHGFGNFVKSAARIGASMLFGKRQEQGGADGQDQASAPTTADVQPENHHHHHEKHHGHKSKHHVKRQEPGTPDGQDPTSAPTTDAQTQPESHHHHHHEKHHGHKSKHHVKRQEPGTPDGQDPASAPTTDTQSQPETRHHHHEHKSEHHDHHHQKLQRRHGFGNFVKGAARFGASMLFGKREAAPDTHWKREVAFTH
ncbi:hypothetical protein FRB91_010713 [Serendipita sp. 411]|nr:hypothetical protein FRB91_010713 [Serendipita sp. 411]